MDLSPNDIRNYEFSNQMRGYEKEAVDSFLEQIAVALENSKQENLKLSMEIDSLKSEVKNLRQYEETIKNAAIDARRNADMTVANAQKEGELIMESARNESESILLSRSAKMSEIESQISNLEVTKKSYLSKFQSMIHNHLDIIKDIVDREEIETSDTGSIQVTDSSEIAEAKDSLHSSKKADKPASKVEEANAAGEIVEVSSEKVAKQESKKPETSSPKASSTDTGEIAIAKAKKQEEPAPSNSEPEAVHETAEAEKSDDQESVFANPDSDDLNLNASAAIKIPQTEEKKENYTEVKDEHDLASELDNIAAKFEEEMDKAEKS